VAAEVAADGLLKHGDWGLGVGGWRLGIS
jgi:hypothetical protein